MSDHKVDLETSALDVDVKKQWNDTAAKGGLSQKGPPKRKLDSSEEEDNSDEHAKKEVKEKPFHKKQNKNSEIEFHFGSKRFAEIIYNSLIVDNELRKNEICREVKLTGPTIKVLSCKNLYSYNLHLFHIKLNYFMDFYSNIT
ncbi:hypothetical protein RFI_22465 [Reticulomyxa filosa]|uniref:Uncharacterized protein n=1 Tax=Reticulomyxa filosa TaxID=46433 RepID=X6MLP2_RETFI|nr:hypothetical protein RFI_22465 [Reticulomyxa filosa]|eukprot:ETO14903.1 hypothetical protein RFI_22465 [Reticulomyxa filosa]